MKNEQKKNPLKNQGIFMVAGEEAIPDALMELQVLFGVEVAVARWK